MHPSIVEHASVRVPGEWLSIALHNGLSCISFSFDGSAAVPIPIPHAQKLQAPKGSSMGRPDSVVGIARHLGSLRVRSSYMNAY